MPVSVGLMMLGVVGSYRKALPFFPSKTTLFAIKGKAAKPKKGCSRFAGDVVTHVVVVGFWVQRAVTDVVSQLHILALFFRVSFDDIRFIIAKIGDQVGDEIALKLSQQDWVIEGAVRAIDPEQVGEAVGHHAEVTGHALGPSRL